MRVEDAMELIRPAVEGCGGPWADLGAGGGTFTLALARLLGPGAEVYAVDRDPAAVAGLRRVAGGPAAARVVPVLADLAAVDRAPELAGVRLGGALLANALHFVARPEEALRRVAAAMAPGARLVVVEYDGRPASRWVPYPVPRARLPALLAAAGFGPPREVGARPSAYGGVLYAAAAEAAPGA